MVDYQIILKDLGSFGRVQLLIIFMLSYAKLMDSFQGLAPVFLSYSPKYRCAISLLDENITLEEEILKYTTPIEKGEYNGCKRYAFDESVCNSTFLGCVNTSAVPINCNHGYYYDKSVFTETAVTKFDLVCDRFHLKSLSISMYEVGTLIGSILFGNLADKIGRRHTSILTYTCALACSFAIAYTDTVVTYMITGTLFAVFTVGCLIATFSYVTEIVESKYRNAVNTFYQCIFSLGYLIETAVAYRSRHWKSLMLALSFIASPFLLFAFIMPESPRWLFASGRIEEGKKVVNKIARFNNHKLDENLWEKVQLNVPIKEKNRNDNKKYSTIDLFKFYETRKMTFKVMYIWIVTYLVYYGILLNAGDLAGDFYLNNAINATLECFAYILGAVLMNKIGRRYTLSGGFFVASTGLIVSMAMIEFTDAKSEFQTAGKVFAFVGKFGTSITYSVVYILTSEIYPTVIRSNGLGVGSLAARIGSISAPFILGLQQTIKWLPSSLFSFLGFTAAFVSLVFPETSNIECMESITEAEYFYKHKKPLKLKQSRQQANDNRAFSVSENL